MINYLEKYNNLPKDLRDKISAPHVMRAIHDMEQKYSVNLAGVVMRVVVKDLRIDELPNFFVYTIGIRSDKSNELIKELKEKVFSEISNYLDYINKESEPAVKKNDLSDIPELKESVKENPEEIKIEKNSTSADFYFSIEDEDEVRKQARDFSDLDKREQIARQVESKIANVMGKINVIFSSEDMSNRLQGVLKTYLRGVRDKVDTKLALERKVENGGLGLDEEISDDILRIIDVINKDEAEHPGRIIKPREFPVPEDKQAMNDGDSKTDSLSGGADYDFSKLDGDIPLKSGAESDTNKKVDSADTEAEIETEDSGNELQIEKSTDKEGDLVLDLSSASKNNGHPKDAINDEIKEDGLDQPKDSENDKKIDIAEVSDVKNDSRENEEIDEDGDAFSSGMIAKARNKQAMNIDSREVSARQFGDMAGKIKMEDIKKVSKLGGPLEEIGSMNLVDFRRLSKNTDEAINKIMRAFKLLEEAGFSKRMEGIKAWHKSPINKLYLAIGQESIIKQKDIKKIIEIRKKDKKEYLSQKEFDAIMELNTKLRY